MPKDVQNLRVHLSNNILSLKDLCLKKVADTFDLHHPAPKRKFYIRRLPLKLFRKRLSRLRLAPVTKKPPQYLEPFKDLPPALMSSLQQILMERKMAFTPHVLPLLVSANTTRLVADLSWYFSTKDKNDLIKRIIAKGQNICELELYFGSNVGVRPNLLREMLRALPRLTSLKLQGQNWDNSIVAMIGSCCPEIRKLSLCTNSICKCNVTDLRYLYDSDLPCGPNGEEYSQCKKLIYLDVKDCHVSTDGPVDVFSNLPELVFLRQ